MDWRDVEHWNADDQPDPDADPGHHRPAPRSAPTPGSARAPTSGTKNALPTTITSNNECGEYYHVAHSHALQQATNYGATFGGMMTVFRIDPPAGCPAK